MHDNYGGVSTEQAVDAQPAAVDGPRVYAGKFGNLSSRHAIQKEDLRPQPHGRGRSRSGGDPKYSQCNGKTQGAGKGGFGIL